MDHKIKLTVPPFSDPTSFSIAICIQHPVLPGAAEVSNDWYCCLMENLLLSPVVDARFTLLSCL